MDNFKALAFWGHYEQKKYKLEFYSRTRLSERPNLHEEMEMVFISEGEVLAHINNRTLKLHKNELILVYPHQLHCYKASADARFFLFIFRPEILSYAQEYCSPGLFAPNVFDCSEMPLTLSVLWQLHSYENFSGPDENQFGFQAYLCGCINLIFSDLLPHLIWNRRNSGQSGLLYRATDYCARHFEEKISLESVAGAINCSYYRLSREFSQKMDITFPAYINYLRISKAGMLLKNTSLSITDIAYAVGYDNVRTFNRVFRKWMNNTPSQFRRNRS